MNDDDAWECNHPVNKDADATPWIGKEVVSRPDGGGWPLLKGIVQEHPRRSLRLGWFNMVSQLHPEGMLAHTQEVYPPGFTACNLPCCSERKNITQQPVL